ncbi:acyl-CoA synthetase [Cytobacillus purgationiresistens]|uniref:Acyl-CoA synthetase (AMP-forming)/AMP-acid ligase II n=1 Tax=Cytobacillus purgationiresistens TaxID=863449 RepID=A0ABU0AGG3_9BACI|nr:long-chain fatty acid--CoA ligase [Cytobacillus purgationiresistens]MDQ0270346.1 acyl-CoA synthetase (AMP-forming)/AMP-acid ligase II [Cytobacillus purgationiresistens]
MSIPNLAHQLLIGEALKYAAHRSPERTAFAFENESLTYRGLMERADHLARWLRDHEIGKDEKIGCLFKNGLSFVEVYFGVSLSEGVLVPVNFRLVPNEIEYILNHSDVKILFIEEELLSQIEPIIAELTKIELVVIVGTAQKHFHKNMINYDSIYNAAVSISEIKGQKDDDAHVIIYTSGTTGRPKGAVLTHKNLYINGMNKCYHGQNKRGTKLLLIPPLFHVAALSLLVSNCMMEGTIVIHRDFQPEKILQTIEKEEINSMFLVPAMWNMLLQVPNLQQYRLDSINSCSTGGAICPLELKKKIMDTFENAGLHEAFGQTEMSPSTTYLSGEESIHANKAESVGKPSLNVRVRVVDDEMNDVPVGEVGEIIYQGPTMMKEYYKNPEATAEAFKGGWFHSEDLVRMDEEGYIYVVDRKKDMIISGGENIYPKELEEVLYTHPSILEAAVVGIPDPKWGETVKAYIVLKKGAQLSAEEVISFSQTKIASYKKPRVIEFLEALPRNATGKVLKTVLRADVLINNRKEG